jgi:hypothetical protein
MHGSGSRMGVEQEAGSLSLFAQPDSYRLNAQKN